MSRIIKFFSPLKIIGSFLPSGEIDELCEKPVLYFLYPSEENVTAAVTKLIVLGA
jgi:hypothetical protein